MVTIKRTAKQVSSQRRFSRPSSKGKSQGLTTGEAVKTTAEKAALTTGTAEVSVGTSQTPQKTSPVVKSTTQKIAEGFKAPRSQFRDPSGAALTSKTFYEVGASGIKPGQGTRVRKVSEQGVPGVRRVTVSYGSLQQQVAAKKKARTLARQEGLSQLKAQEKKVWVKELQSKQRASRELRSTKPLSTAYRQSLQRRVPKVQEGGVLRGNIGLLTPSVYGVQKNLGVTKKRVEDFYRREAQAKNQGLGGRFIKLSPQEKQKSPGTYYGKRLGRGVLGGLALGQLFTMAKSTSLGGAVQVVRTSPLVGTYGAPLVLGGIGAAAQYSEFKGYYKSAKEASKVGSFKEGVVTFAKSQERRSAKKRGFFKKYSGEIVEAAGTMIGFGGQQLGEAQYRYDTSIQGGFGKVKAERTGDRLGGEVIQTGKGEYSFNGKQVIVKAKSVTKEKPFGAGTKGKDVTFYRVYEKTPTGRGKLLGKIEQVGESKIVGSKWQRTFTQQGKTKTASGTLVSYKQGGGAFYEGKIYAKGKAKQTVIGRSTLTYGKTTPGAPTDTFFEKWQSDVVTRNVPPKKLPKPFRGSKGQLTFGRPSTPREQLWPFPTTVQPTTPSVTVPTRPLTQSAGMIPKTFGVGVKGSLFSLTSGGASLGLLSGAALVGATSVGLATSRPKAVSGMKPLTRAYTAPSTKVLFDYASVPTPISEPVPYVSPKPLATPEPVSVTQPLSFGRTIFSGSATIPTPTPTLFPFTPIPPFVPLGFGLPNLQFQPKRRRKTVLKKQKKRYTPSLLAVEFNIRGKQPKKLSGFEIRPLPKRKGKKVKLL